MGRITRFGSTRSWMHHTDGAFSRGAEKAQDTVYVGGLKLTKRMLTQWIHHAYSKDATPR